MELLMIGHLLGDFYFQTDVLSNRKKEDCKYLVLHVMIYLLTLYGVLILSTRNGGKYIGSIALIGLGHMIIDYVKINVEKSYRFMDKYQLLTLAVDQMLHIGILWMFRQKCTLEINFQGILGMIFNTENQMNEVLIILSAILICGKPAAIIVAKLFERIPKTIQSAEKTEDRMVDAIQGESVKIGSWVGILEREIILILGLLGQYGAIGFVLAAKSLARHNQLNNQAFAEKYLVGTLLSALIALASVLGCTWLIKN